jgi:hypothetical protein
MCLNTKVCATTLSTFVGVTDDEPRYRAASHHVKGVRIPV